MNYIAEINGFERWLETHQLPVLSQLLWYKLMQWSSRSGWPEWTQVDNRRLMVSLQIAREASLTESRDRLVNAGLVEYQKGRKGMPGRYRMISYEKYATENTYKLKVQTEIQSVVYPEVYSEVHSVALIKDKKKQKENIDISAPDERVYVDDAELNAALVSFVRYRREIEAPMTDQAIDLLVKELEKIAPGDTEKKIELLNRSIMNGWKGVFNPKNTTAQKTQKKSGPKANRFHNFDAVGYDYDKIVKELNG